MKAIPSVAFWRMQVVGWQEYRRQKVLVYIKMTI